MAFLHYLSYFIIFIIIFSIVNVLIYQNYNIPNESSLVHFREKFFIRKIKKYAMQSVFICDTYTNNSTGRKQLSNYIFLSLDKPKLRGKVQNRSTLLLFLITNPLLNSKYLSEYTLRHCKIDLNLSQCCNMLMASENIRYLLTKVSKAREVYDFFLKTRSYFSSLPNFFFH